MNLDDKTKLRDIICQALLLARDARAPRTVYRLLELVLSEVIVAGDPNAAIYPPSKEGGDQ